MKVLVKLLTFHFDCCSFMMAYLLDSKESRHVKDIFNSIEHAIGTFSFSSAFSLILTDRGSEFQNPEALECGQDNLIRTRIYYCDPMCSWQKPHFYFSVWNLTLHAEFTFSLNLFQMWLVFWLQTYESRICIFIFI